mmetsp:Transcript_10008/g.20280  ORF Transcript_10008/g.20280 Transcript_10008/m.20280 type:complete len:274 (+) Transcript_10008:51-872(+)
MIPTPAPMVGLMRSSNPASYSLCSYRRDYSGKAKVFTTPSSSPTPQDTPPASPSSSSTPTSNHSVTPSQASLPPTSEAACFPGNSTVELLSGKRVQLFDLKLGDYVRVGIETFEPIYFFGHRHPSIESEFLKINLGEEMLSVSSNHLVFDHSRLRRPAEALRPGDMVIHGPTGTLRTVQQISRSKQVGLYAPHTASGELIVDDILVSCFTTAISPTAAHALLAPIRLSFSVAGVSAFQSRFEKRSWANLAERAHTAVLDLSLGRLGFPSRPGA